MLSDKAGDVALTYSIDDVSISWQPPPLSGPTWNSGATQYTFASPQLYTRPYHCTKAHRRLKVHNPSKYNTWVKCTVLALQKCSKQLQSSKTPHPTAAITANPGHQTSGPRQIAPITSLKTPTITSTTYTKFGVPDV